MSIISVFVVLIIVGVALYLVNSVIPMVAWMQTVINCVAGVLVLLWLLQIFGVGVGHLPRLR